MVHGDDFFGFHNGKTSWSQVFSDLRGGDVCSLIFGPFVDSVYLAALSTSIICLGPLRLIRFHVILACLWLILGSL